MYIYLWLIHVVLWQKTNQHHKAIFLQLKKKKKKKETRIPLTWVFDRIYLQKRFYVGSYCSFYFCLYLKFANIKIEENSVINSMYLWSSWEKNLN